MAFNRANGTQTCGMPGIETGPFTRRPYIEARPYQACVSIQSGRPGSLSNDRCVAFGYFFHIEYLLLINQDGPFLLALNGRVTEQQEAVFPLLIRSLIRRIGSLSQLRWTIPRFVLPSVILTRMYLSPAVTFSGLGIPSSFIEYTRAYTTIICAVNR